MKFAIFGLSASVDIRPLPGAWIAELLGIVLEVQDHKKIKFHMATLGLKGLRVLRGIKQNTLKFKFNNYEKFKKNCNSYMTFQIVFLIK